MKTDPFPSYTQLYPYPDTSTCGYPITVDIRHGTPEDDRIITPVYPERGTGKGTDGAILFPVF